MWTVWPSAWAATLQTMWFMTLAMLFSERRATMPMGGSGSKAEAVGVCGVAGAADAIVEAEGGMHIGGSGSKLEAIGICGVASWATSTAVPRRLPWRRREWC